MISIHLVACKPLASSMGFLKKFIHRLHFFVDLRLPPSSHFGLLCCWVTSQLLVKDRDPEALFVNRSKNKKKINNPADKVTCRCHVLLAFVGFPLVPHGVKYLVCDTCFFWFWPREAFFSSFHSLHHSFLSFFSTSHCAHHHNPPLSSFCHVTHQQVFFFLSLYSRLFCFCVNGYRS